MRPSMRQDGFVYRHTSVPSSRSSSVSSEALSPTTNMSLLGMPIAHPSPAYVASAPASAMASDNQKIRERDLEGFDHHPEFEGADFSEGALAMINAYLDQLLYSFLSAADSTNLLALRTAVEQVLKGKLARQAIASADEELDELLTDADLEDEASFENKNDAVRTKGELDTTWRRTRLRVMVYMRLGEMEDEDEERYVEEQFPDYNEDFKIYSPQSAGKVGLVSWAAAIFLTSVIEYIAEQCVTIAGHAAFDRVSMKLASQGQQEQALKEDIHNGNILIKELDAERVALNSTLGRLWRTWRRTLRTTHASPTTRGGAWNAINSQRYSTLSQQIYEHEGQRSAQSTHSATNSIDGVLQTNGSQTTPRGMKRPTSFVRFPVATQGSRAIMSWQTQALVEQKALNITLPVELRRRSRSLPSPLRLSFTSSLRRRKSETEMADAEPAIESAATLKAESDGTDLSRSVSTDATGDDKLLATGKPDESDDKSISKDITARMMSTVEGLRINATKHLSLSSIYTIDASHRESKPSRYSLDTKRASWSSRYTINDSKRVSRSSHYTIDDSSSGVALNGGRQLSDTGAETPSVADDDFKTPPQEIANPMNTTSSSPTTPRTPHSVAFNRSEKSGSQNDDIEQEAKSPTSILGSSPRGRKDGKNDVLQLSTSQERQLREIDSSPDGSQDIKRQEANPRGKYTQSHLQMESAPNTKLSAIQDASSRHETASSMATNATVATVAGGLAAGSVIAAQRAFSHSKVEQKQTKANVEQVASKTQPLTSVPIDTPATKPASEQHLTQPPVEEPLSPKSRVPPHDEDEFDPFRPKTAEEKAVRYGWPLQTIPVYPSKPKVPANNVLPGSINGNTMAPISPPSQKVLIDSLPSPSKQKISLNLPAPSNNSQADRHYPNSQQFESGSLMMMRPVKEPSLALSELEGISVPSQPLPIAGSAVTTAKAMKNDASQNDTMQESNTRNAQNGRPIETQAQLKSQANILQNTATDHEIGPQSLRTHKTPRQWSDSNVPIVTPYTGTKVTPLSSASESTRSSQVSSINTRSGHVSNKPSEDKSSVQRLPSTTSSSGSKVTTSSNRLYGKSSLEKDSRSSSERDPGQLEAPSEKSKGRFSTLVDGEDTVKYTLTPKNLRDIERVDSASSRQDAAAVKYHVVDYSNFEPPMTVDTAGSNLQNDFAERSPLSTTSSRDSFRLRPGTSGYKQTKAGHVAREARIIQTESTRDFVDFIRSTAPPKDGSAFPKPLPESVVRSQAPSAYASAYGSANVSTNVSANVSRRPSLTSPTGAGSFANMASNQQTSRGRKRMSSHLSQKNKGLNERDNNADLISFLSTGPPGASVSKTQADSQLNRSYDNNQSRTSIGRASSQTSQSGYAASNSSRSGLLGSKISGTSTSRVVVPPQSNVAPVRKQRRAKDPYAIDDDDDEYDDPDVMPRLRETKEESLVDFLRNNEPPASSQQHKTSHYIASRAPKGALAPRSNNGHAFAAAPGHGATHTSTFAGSTSHGRDNSAALPDFLTESRTTKGVGTRLGEMSKTEPVRKKEKKKGFFGRFF